MVDPTVIERMARLRGIGDAYHDYRGELRYFTAQTKRASGLSGQWRSAREASSRPRRERAWSGALARTPMVEAMKLAFHKASRFTESCSRTDL